MLESAFGWIGKIADWLGQWFPRWEIVDTTEAGIKWVKGVPKACPGGQVWWHWPVTTKWTTFPTARQTDRLETQTMESADGVTFIVGAMITYEVVDVLALGAYTFSPTRTVVDIAMTSVHDVCGELSWSELRAKQAKGTLKTALKNDAQKQLEPFGVKVIKLQLTTLARARVYKISQSTATEEN